MKALESGRGGDIMTGRKDWCVLKNSSDVIKLLLSLFTETDYEKKRSVVSSRSWHYLKLSVLPAINCYVVQNVNGFSLLLVRWNSLFLFICVLEGVDISPGFFFSLI